eukprot:2859634-Prymnesium_polylepis.1
MVEATAPSCVPQWMDGSIYRIYLVRAHTLSCAHTIGRPVATGIMPGVGHVLNNGYNFGIPSKGLADVARLLVTK